MKKSGADSMTSSQRERWKVLGYVSNHLAPLPDEAVNAWWRAPLAFLDGGTAEDYFATEFDPDDARAATLMASAEAAGALAPRTVVVESGEPA
jgi:hypothetical protein